MTGPIENNRPTVTEKKSPPATKTDDNQLATAISRLVETAPAKESQVPKAAQKAAAPPATPKEVEARLTEARPSLGTAALSGAGNLTTWSFATRAQTATAPGPAQAQAPANPAGEEEPAETPGEFTQATQTVAEHFEVFDNPGNPEDGDGKISDRDFRRVAEGNYDREQVAARLEAEGLSQEEIEATLSEIEEAAQFFVESDIHRHALDGADGDRNNRITAEGVQARLEQSQAYDEALERHQNVTEVTDPQQAISILQDFRTLADTANGEGGVDQEIGRSDLEAILADPHAPDSLKAAASYLLDDANSVIFHAVDAGAEGASNGKITFGNLDQAAGLFENFNQDRGPVENTLEAAQVLEDYFYLADSASGGNGGRDGQVSFDDLENLANSEAVPESVRQAARHFLELHQSNPENLLALRPEFSQVPIDLEHLRAFNEAPEVLRELLVSAGPEIGEGYIKFVDGRPVLASSGEPLTAEQYAALQAQWQQQIEDPEAVALLSRDFAWDLDEVTRHYDNALDSISSDLSEQTARVQEETENFGRFIAEYGALLSPEELADLTAQHEARVAELEAPLEQQAADFVALAEDPIFQQAFLDFSQEEQEQFFATVADSVGNTEAGSQFAEDLLSELEQLGEGDPPTQLSPFARQAQTLIQSGKDVSTLKQAVTVLASRQLLNSGTAGSDAYAKIGRFLYGAEYADEVQDALRSLEVAATQGEDAYRAARANLDEALRNNNGRGPTGALDFLAVGALAVDALIIQEQGFEALADPQFALNAAKDLADTVSIVSRVFGAGSRTLTTLARVGNGFGALAGGIGLAQGIAEGDALQIASGGLTLVGYGLLAFGVGGPIGPLLLAGGVVASFLPALLEGDPYRDYLQDRFEEAGLPFDSLQSFNLLSPEAQAEVGAIAEEYGLSRAQVAQMAFAGFGLGSFPEEGAEGASQLREAFANNLDPFWSSTPLAPIPEGEHLDAYRDLESQTGLDGEELQNLIGFVAQDAYLEFLAENPDSTLSLREYWTQNLADFADQVPGAVEEAREARPDSGVSSGR